MARRVFLERRTYRKNRLQDAARLLPVLGMILFFGPVFISDDTGGEAGAGTGLAEWLVYCFVVWAMLIALTALVNRALGANEKRQGRAAPSAPTTRQDS
jgi:hypothetical protein